MPQLFSRMDDMNWLTPTIADILEQGAAPPGGDGSIRQQMLTLQQELEQLGTPARVVNMRPTPSHTRFIIRPEIVGRLGNRRTITRKELHRSIRQIAEQHTEWQIGFIPQIDEEDDTAGVLLRTSDHRPLSLRRLMVRSSYRDYPSTLAYPLGSTLDENLVIGDLEQNEHLMFIGETNARNHAVSAVLLTLSLLNTPAELRFVLAGSRDAAHVRFAQLPHSLGKPVSSTEQIVRLIKGLAREVQRRLDSFYEEGVSFLSAYNARQQEQNAPSVPRILFLLDSLSDEAVRAAITEANNELRDLLVNGPQAGAHILLTVDQRDDQPDAVRELIHTELVLRSAEPELAERIDSFHPSLRRFVDAFVIELREERITPVELASVSTGEIQAAVDYWRQAAQKRAQESPSEQTSGATGLTGMLPPTPTTDIAQTLQTGDNLPFDDENVSSPLLGQCAALAGYTGWLSVGMLRDVLRLSETQAHSVIASLQTQGILTGTDHHIGYFAHKAATPEND